MHFFATGRTGPAFSCGETQNSTLFRFLFSTKVGGDWCGALPCVGVLLVLSGSDAIGFERRFKIALMQPRVRSVFDPLQHREGLVIGAGIFGIGIFVQHRWPNEGPAPFRLHRLCCV
jgi:hypothetical protein